MNREIKFRAWDENNKIMVSDIDDLIYEYSLTLNFLVNNSRYKLMQYTGLKDKNGKEIYEGDCFSIDSKKTGTRIGIATVIWNERHLCYELEDTLNRGEYNLHWFAKNQPVIGNIYENKDLLK